MARVRLSTCALISRGILRVSNRRANAGGRNLATSLEHIAHSLGLRPGSRIDLHGGGHSRREHHALGHLIDVDAHRDALREAHPGEDRVDGREPLPVGLRVRDIDGAGDAVDMAANDLAGSPSA